MGEKKRKRRRRRPRPQVRARQNILLTVPVVILAAARLLTHNPAPGPLDLFADAAGALAIAFGLWIRICARQWKAENSHDRLVSTGLYAYIRHPLYVGSFLLWTGICLFFHDPVLFGLCLAAFVAQHALVIRSEEAFLEQLFGEEFREYRRRVNGFFPKPGTPPQRIVPHRIGDAVLRETDAISAAAGAPLLIALVQWAAAEHSGASPGSAVPSVVGLGAVVLVWGALKTRYWKRKRAMGL